MFSQLAKTKKVMVAVYLLCTHQSFQGWSRTWYRGRSAALPPGYIHSVHVITWSVRSWRTKNTRYNSWNYQPMRSSNRQLSKRRKKKSGEKEEWISLKKVTDKEWDQDEETYCRYRKPMEEWTHTHGYKHNRLETFLRGRIVQSCYAKRGYLPWITKLLF